MRRKFITRGVDEGSLLKVLCHPERSEGSSAFEKHTVVFLEQKILHCRLADQNDNLFLDNEQPLVQINHYRKTTRKILKAISLGELMRLMN
ncbi:hypothetical protein BH09BAC6_BH09BAC6_30010 [soil metagenome]|jgi:hypothetical protein